MKNENKTMATITALCQNRGFVFQGSQIYGGLANSWDYGPLGVELKKNVKPNRELSSKNSDQRKAHNRKDLYENQN